MALLEVRNITKKFGGLVANDNVTFDTMQDEILGIIGPNGAGKTTLFNCITGYYHRYDTGDVYFKNKKISGLRPHAICRHGIARTFQVVNVFSDMTALENVMVGAFIKTEKVELAKKNAIKYLSELKIEYKKDVQAGNLTLSDRKKLEVARALATEPELILLDEVAGGLNSAEVLEFIDIVKSINTSGITIIMIEHVMEAVMSVANRIVVLDGGQKISEGTPQEVASDKKVIEAYLGEEYHA